MATPELVDMSIFDVEQLVDISLFGSPDDSVAQVIDHPPQQPERRRSKLFWAMILLTLFLKALIIWRVIYQPQKPDFSLKDIAVLELNKVDPEPPNQQAVLTFSMGCRVVSQSVRWKEWITYQSVLVYVTYYEDLQLVVTDEINLNPSNTSTWIQIFKGAPIILPVDASISLGEDFQKQHFTFYLHVGGRAKWFFQPLLKSGHYEFTAVCPISVDTSLGLAYASSLGCLSSFS